MSNSNKAWSTAQTTQVTSAYATANQDNTVLATIAKDMGKTVNSIRAKLVSEKVYVANEPRAVGGASPVRKMAIVRKIADKLELANIDSLEKATKDDLEALLSAIS